MAEVSSEFPALKKQSEDEERSRMKEQQVGQVNPTAEPEPQAAQPKQEPEPEQETPTMSELKQLPVKQRLKLLNRYAELQNPELSKKSREVDLALKELQLEELKARRTRAKIAGLLNTTPENVDKEMAKRAQSIQQLVTPQAVAPVAQAETVYPDLDTLVTAAGGRVGNAAAGQDTLNAVGGGFTLPSRENSQALLSHIGSPPAEREQG